MYAYELCFIRYRYVLAELRCKLEHMLKGFVGKWGTKLPSVSFGLLVLIAVSFPFDDRFGGGNQQSRSQWSISHSVVTTGGRFGASMTTMWEI
ncbi:hypothetical protein L6452_16489 [Arctium lappa]|uniref:Uncharacterized protein n=1 Tax=Arctium lappa TaxID=4217 RepID=A0ACB9C0V3_ARCLA|nr:hypothetical protein L6452_16489 [Arctium lappa]